MSLGVGVSLTGNQEEGWCKWYHQRKVVSQAWHMVHLMANQQPVQSHWCGGPLRREPITKAGLSGKEKMPPSTQVPWGGKSRITRSVSRILSMSVSKMASLWGLSSPKYLPKSGQVDAKWEGGGLLLASLQHLRSGFGPHVVSSLFSTRSSQDLSVSMAEGGSREFGWGPAEVSYHVWDSTALKLSTDRNPVSW